MKEPIRLFQSDFLERFTHISPIAVLVLWVPVSVGFLIRSVALRPDAVSPAYSAVGFVAGLFLWTLAEYLLHRFVFHFRPKTPRQERMAFLFHGIHHSQPMVKSRLVMPFALSIPLALLFYGLYWLVVGRLLGIPHWIAPLFSGFVAGYIAYDMIHYTTHHFRMDFPFFRTVKQHHLRHHGESWEHRFGVSSPMWDHVFGTMPEQR
jgi:sterol desaturase/sphingolipid hydroxylase (fatty acid hydroxylase superfamily)